MFRTIQIKAVSNKSQIYLCTRQTVAAMHLGLMPELIKLQRPYLHLDKAKSSCRRWPTSRHARRAKAYSIYQSPSKNSVKQQHPDTQAKFLLPRREAGGAVAYCFLLAYIPIPYRIPRPSYRPSLEAPPLFTFTFARAANEWTEDDIFSSELLPRGRPVVGLF